MRRKRLREFGEFETPKKRWCGICGRLKLSATNILLIIFVCAAMYVANHFEMKRYREKKIKEQEVREKALRDFATLQDKCFLQNNEKACEILKKFE
ncbi:hypothetical protein [Helicobacter himalayensis]|uniref:hypothetical protein n=1 Tax=Helicobacter himalayensis TaxID=1591088 RepID=UPI00082A8FB3|nr:hypothetical protein [Helicobacter himalayensis]